MNSRKDPPFTDDDGIETTAAAWLVERDEGFTAEREAEFARWRDADPRHARAVAELEETCGILHLMPLVRGRLETKSGEISPRPDRSGRDTPAPGRIIRFPAALKVAATIAACLVLATGIWTLRRDRVEFSHTYTTSAGDYVRVRLPDDSELQLNAGTEVRVALFKSIRQLTLKRGEAHFTVAPDPTRPFAVAAGGIAVRAVGTAFNVRLDQDEVDVLVSEGSVLVSRATDPAMRAPGAASAPDSGALVGAGQRLVVATGVAAVFAPKITTVDPADIREALAWQAPRLVFLDTPLADVVAQFNEHNRVQLVIGDDELGRRAVGGTFRADHVEAFVRLLEDSRDVAVERPDPDRIILRKVSPAR